jgi:hypothetical protein
MTDNQRDNRFHPFPLGKYTRPGVQLDWVFGYLLIFVLVLRSSHPARARIMSHFLDEKAILGFDFFRNPIMKNGAGWMQVLQQIF